MCGLGLAVTLTLQPVMVETPFGYHPLTPPARDAFVNNLIKKMTLDEDVGQLRLMSVGPDNPKAAIREMIKKVRLAQFSLPSPVQIFVKCRTR